MSVRLIPSSHRQRWRTLNFSAGSFCRYSATTRLSQLFAGRLKEPSRKPGPGPERATAIGAGDAEQVTLQLRLSGRGARSWEARHRTSTYRPAEIESLWCVQLGGAWTHVDSVVECSVRNARNGVSGREFRCPDPFTAVEDDGFTAPDSGELRSIAEDAHHIVQPGGRVTTDAEIMFPSDLEIVG